jgi:hypothetical protein
MRKRLKTHDDLPFRLICTYNTFALNIKPSDHHSPKNHTSHRKSVIKRSLLHVAKMSRSERASRIGPLYDGLYDSAVDLSYFGHISRGSADGESVLVFCADILDTMACVVVINWFEGC